MEETIKFRRAVITGPTGAIGLALCEKLLSEHIEVYAICRPGTVRAAHLPEGVELVWCDASELGRLPEKISKEVDLFYHFAWSHTIGPGRNDIPAQIENIYYTLDAVKAAKALSCHTFIGAGSQAEYGRVEGLIRAETPCFPENGYGMAKLCAGQMSREYAHQLGLKHIWVRILSVYGPHDGAQTMVMSTIKKLQEGIVPKFTKGEQIWDYLYSGDAAKAFYLLGKKGIDGKIYILGSGEGRPLSEYINEIREVVNPKEDIELGTIPYGEKQVMYLVADISELQKDVAFETSVKFNEGIKMIISESK